MIEKKSLLAAIKRALQTGGFQLIGQELTAFPIEVCRIDTLVFDDQNWWDCNPITKMDLSNNSISELPAEIVKLPDLQLIRLKNNLVKQLPPQLFELQNLKSLDLAKNKLQALPQEIQRATTLVELVLSGNEMIALPQLHQLGCLEVLMLDGNKIGLLPILPKALKRLDVSSNQLTVLTRQQTQFCRGLQYLNLNKNHITEIEQGALAQCNSLVSLEIKENRLVSLTDLPKSEKLDIVAVSFNRIREFEQFENCPNLTVLILSDNKVEKLSAGIIHLKKLKTLDISNNDLSDLPSQLGLLPALVRIQLEGNPLKCIRQNLRTAGAEQLKKYLKERMDAKDFEKAEKKVADPRLQMGSSLSPWQKLVMECTTGNELVIRGQGLQELDVCVFKPNITVLNLTQNKLSSLPQDIRNMTQLRSLVLSENLFERLPEDVLRLSSLEQLEVKKNKLDDFGSAKSQVSLDRLYLLDLSVNRIGRVPQAILRLPRLRILHLSYNKLQSAEELFAKNILPLLEVLDLSNNHLSDLPDSVANRHATLNFLNIENNGIGRLPTLLGFMRLTGLKVDGNPLKLIKRSVIDKGTVALLEDLRTKHQGPPPVFEAVEKPPPLPRTKNEDKMQCQEDEPPQPLKPANLSQAQRNEITVRIQQITQQIGRIEHEVENNLSMNRLQKAEKKRQTQALLIERNKLQQML